MESFSFGEASAQQPADDEVLKQVMEEMGQPVFKSSVESRTSEDRTYFAAFGGASVHKITEGNVDLNPTLAGLGSFDFDDSTDIGPMFGLKVGRTFGRFSVGGESVPEPDKVYFLGAVEGELFYSNFSTDGVVQHNFPANVSITGDADLNMIVGSVNGILRMQYHWFRPYVGLGMGLASVWTDDARVNISNPLPPPGAATLENSSSDWVLAGQGLAGIEVQLHQDWALFLEYKFLYLHEPNLKDSTFNLDYDYIGQSFVTAGLKFYLP